jgi:WD40 repeat protein
MNAWTEITQEEITSIVILNEQWKQQEVASVSLSEDGARIVIGTGDGSVKVVDVGSVDGILSLEEDAPHPTALGVEILEEHVEFLPELDIDEEEESEDSVCVAISLNGARIISGSTWSDLKIWDAGTGACMQTLEGHTQRVCSAAVSACGERVISGSEDRTVKVWETESGRCLRTLVGHSGGVRSVSISASGDNIVSGSEDMTVKVWDAHSGACLRTLTTTEAVRSAAVSADGARVVSGSFKSVKVWAASTGVCTQTLNEQAGGLVAISGDGTRVLSAETSTVKVWDADSGAFLCSFHGSLPTDPRLWGNFRMRPVLSVAISADGLRIAAGFTEALVKIWDAPPGRDVEWMLAFAMGQHQRLGAGTAVRLLDVDLVLLIGSDVLARTWEP